MSDGRAPKSGGASCAWVGPRGGGADGRAPGGACAGKHASVLSVLRAGGARPSLPTSSAEGGIPAAGTPGCGSERTKSFTCMKGCEALFWFQPTPTANISILTSNNYPVSTHTSHWFLIFPK